nr:MAG TPA: hypothetical protein [Caudoviricetes sp.]
MAVGKSRRGLTVRECAWSALFLSHVAEYPCLEEWGA